MGDLVTAVQNVRRPDWHIVARIVVLTALLVARCFAYSAAGGLWRDEVHSVDIANLPADDLFFVLTHDSFPMLWAGLLRSWILVFGSSDEAVRALGFLIGVAIIPAMWWTARQFDVTFPWWTMVLLGLDPSMIVFGGEVRGYGLGILTFLVLIGMSWRTLRHPSAWQWIALSVSAFLAVQSSYTNCFMLAATFIACGIVAVSRGRFFVCLGFALVGMLAATSMLPYGLYVLPRMSKAIKLLWDPVSWHTPVMVFLRAFAWGGVVRCLVWPVVALIGFRELLDRLKFRSVKYAEQTASERDLSLFLLFFCGLGTAGFWSYILFLGVPTQSWYHLPFLAVLAVTADFTMELWSRQPQRRHLPIVGSVVLACMLIFCEVLASTMHYRLTTIDLIAGDLTRVVQKGDLIVVVPWYLGITFNRYYDGPAEWMNLPDIDRDRRHCGYEEQIERVMPFPTPVGIEMELKKIEAVLQSGGKVWWISAHDSYLHQPKGTAPLILAGAPDPKRGWNEFAYITSWMELAITRMHETGAESRKVIAERTTRMNPHENVMVYMFELPREHETIRTRNEETMNRQPPSATP